MGIDYDSKISNNVDLAHDKRLRRALEAWQPRFLDWWKEMGPDGYQAKDVYLRTAVGVDRDGWAQFDYVKMPDYRWGIFLTPQEQDRMVPFGDHAGEAAWEEVPGEYRAMLRRIVVTQADTEPASVEQQRQLAKTAPSLYDMRNLFQVNVEEARHLWAMVYLLHKYFGRDGRDEADELLERRSGDADKPRILDAFNEPCNEWLSFFCFTCFTDRDGKFQLAALAESGFSPLARSTRFMLTEEAHHLFVGESGMERILTRSAELSLEAPGGKASELGGIDLEVIQKYVNYWFGYCLDLFGSETSSNATDWFSSGLKGRFREEERFDEHRLIGQTLTIPVVEDGALVPREVPLRNALNEVLRNDYRDDCQRVVNRWNKALAKTGHPFRIELASTRFYRRQGVYGADHFDPQGNLISDAEWAAHEAEWLPTDADRQAVLDVMVPVTEPGKFAQWISPPRRGINKQDVDFEYVRL